MTTIYCTGQFSFDIADISDENLNTEFRRRKELVSKLKGEWQESLEEKEAADFSASELVVALNGKGLELNPWAFEVYRMIADRPHRRRHGRNAFGNPAACAAVA